MKMRVFVLSIALAIAPAAAETIPASQASTHVGQSVTVEGTATNVYPSCPV